MFRILRSVTGWKFSLTRTEQDGIRSICWRELPSRLSGPPPCFHRRPGTKRERRIETGYLPSQTIHPECCARSAASTASWHLAVSAVAVSKEKVITGRVVTSLVMTLMQLDFPNG